MSFESYTIPIPYLGLNQVDPIDAVPAEFALDIANLYGESGRLKLRGGCEVLTDTGEGAPVEGLYSLRLQSGAEQLIAAVNNELHEVSTGTTSDITGSTTPTSDQWNATVFGNALYLCNGADTAQGYNGSSTFQDLTFTGVTLANLINVSSYKERLYFIEKDSGSAWYGGTKVTGLSATPALTEFDVGYVFKKGGFLLACGSWSDNIGDNRADLWWACSSEGEIVFYSGSYPGDSAWTLVARHPIGRPMGYRAFVRVNSDVWIITEQGIVPISALFQAGSAASESVSRSVNPYLSTYAKQVGFSHRWHGAHWPNGRRVYLNIPISSNDTRILVYNTDTGGWFPYEYSNAGVGLSWAVHDGFPHHGDSGGVVYKAENAKSDNGDFIQYRLRTPFHFFGSRGAWKRFLDVRPLVRTQRGISLGIAVDTDFKETASAGTINATSGSSTPWGSPWGSPWGAGTDYIFERSAVEGQGHSGAIRIFGSIKDVPLEFNALQVRFESGGQV